MLHPCPIHLQAVEAPDRPAIIDADRQIDYGLLDRLVDGTAQELAAWGMQGGTRVALYLPNTWRAVVLLAALVRRGAVACFLSTRLPVTQVQARCREVGASLLITDAETLQGKGVLPPQELVPEPDPATNPVAVPDWSLAQPATLVYTSGSTGRPRAALHTLGNHVYSALGSNRNIAPVPGDRWLLSLPLYHVGGLAICFRCLLAGAAVVVPVPGEPMGVTLARFGITHVSMVATQLQRLLREGELSALSRLRAVLLGGSAIPSVLVAQGHARGLPLFTSYGLTEMASQVTATPPGATVEQLGSSGRVLPFRQLMIAADGEILVRGETLFQGYGQGGGGLLTLDADGWYPTGDLGRLDDGGFLHVTGRKDNLFISGGENIQPEEIEAALQQLDGVAQAVVVPVSDVAFGFRPVAFVQGEGVRLDGLAARLVPTLPKYMIPVAFYAWPAGETRGMKVDRAFFKAAARQRYHG